MTPLNKRSNRQVKTGTVVTAPYRDAALPLQRRVSDLLSRMTLAEKAAQMRCVWQKKSGVLVDALGNFDQSKAEAAFAEGYGLGQIARPSDSGTGKGARGTAELTISRLFILLATVLVIRHSRSKTFI